MPVTPSSVARWLLGLEPKAGGGHLGARWLFLRALGVIFLTAFYSLMGQIHGLIGPDGILPAGHYLGWVGEQLGPRRFWFAPTLLWLASGSRALRLLCAAGLVASIAVVLNLWPRAALAVCLVTFLSFVSAAQDFSEYQSDGMLLEAGFLSLFFAPPGLRPRLGERCPPSPASRLLLRWLWFRIYFESGLVKILSGEPQWRQLTAMDHYYENGPLPDWIGWYAEQLPHGFHASVALVTLALELGLVWMVFLPRPFRLLAFLIATPFQVGIILTANLGFLNYLVLALGVLLVDDRFLASAARRLGLGFGTRDSKRETRNAKDSLSSDHAREFSRRLSRLTRPLSLFVLAWVFYVTTALLLLMVFPRLPLPFAPIRLLQPFRIADRYGLFAIMTRARYEIEFQGTRDGQAWIPYPFRYKPQDPRQAPRIHAPYQPRFDWNLWFASLGSWREYTFVLRTQERLLQASPSVLSLFAGNPFSGDPPRQVRAVRWQYWFSDSRTKRAEGLWWRREFQGLYAPTLEREPDGKIVVAQLP